MQLKNMYKRWSLLALIAVSSAGSLFAQSRIYIHSHNDYCQRVPFYQAYSQQVYSIEADIYTNADETGLLVAHDRDELPTALTIDELYINPIVTQFKRNQGKPWADNDHTLQLMIDLKTEEHPTLDLLVKKLQQYPEVFDPSVNPKAVKVLITGNTPKPEDFNNYPDFIFFDGRPQYDYTPEQLERIGLVSDSFDKYSHWNGKGAIIAPEKDKINQVIHKVHNWGKPVRFWGTPDGVTAWNIFHDMGIDIINTDKPELCSDFFKDFDRKNMQLAEKTVVQVSEEKARATRLDKATRSFEGFDQSSSYLKQPVEIYQPTFQSDNANRTPKNIILMIGDGMGLAQICAAQTVNQALTMLQLKHIGLLKTQAKDQYTTDSAGAGSSIATGQPTCNRYISANEDGSINPSLTEILAPRQYACGIVTLGNIADATPAAFYGHTTERDQTDEITRWLLKGNLSLLNGSGMSALTDRKDGINLKEELAKQYVISTSVDEMNTNGDKEICVDERMGKATTEESLPLLAEATQKAIQKLKNAGSKGFFLMIEGAKVDYAGHANFLPGSVLETLSFDQAVAEALRFADQNGETLVIVTADHETGGLTLIDGNVDKKKITARYMTDDHTPIMVPVFAYGPGSSKFCGAYQNTEIFHKILEILQIKP